MIDDSQEITDLISEVLMKKGIDVQVTNDPRRGLERIKEEKFDVILLDNHMPGFWGVDIIQTLENENILKDQKIIMLSGADFTHNEINDLVKKEGVKDFLKKPIRIDALFTAISN